MATAQDVIKVAQNWIGHSERNGKYKEILDVYNSHKPLARGWKAVPTDDWCDEFVSACFIKVKATDLVGTECGVPKHVDIFKQKGIWNENGAVAPKPGWLIVYAWGKDRQPNDAAPKHIGIVESVNDAITVIEGNYHDAVGRRLIPVGWGFIRGYAMPKYATATKLNLDAVAKEVIAGKWGNGATRKEALAKAGYDPAEVQKRVNALLK